MSTRTDTGKHAQGVLLSARAVRVPDAPEAFEATRVGALAYRLSWKRPAGPAASLPGYPADAAHGVVGMRPIARTVLQARPPRPERRVRVRGRARPWACVRGCTTCVCLRR